jgi:spore coat polysaccharide biosynthesis protein SpsF
MKLVATIEARMNSSRLPGKVLFPVLGRPLLSFLIERLKSVQSIDEIVIATTVNKIDEPIVELAKSLNVSFFRGSENDVMSRVIGAAESHEANSLVEITGDCPILDPDLVEQTIQVFLKNNVDYCANSYFSSYPSGMDTQVIRLDALKRSYSMTEDDLDYEHVSRHIVNNPQIFKHAYLIAPPSLTWPTLALTVDEQGDYDLVSRIIEELYPTNGLFSCADVINFLSAHSHFLDFNKTIERKNIRPSI